MRDVFARIPALFDFDDDFFSAFSIPRKEMRTNILEKDDRYVLNIELPGYSKENIKVSLKDGNLIIEASKKEDKEEDSHYVLVERKHESVRRSFSIGHEITEEDISASYEGGILKIEIMKKEKPEIPVNYIEVK